MKTRPGAAIYNPPGTSMGTAASIDAGITSETDLAAVVTSILNPGAIREWVKAADGTVQVWRLIAGTVLPGEGIVIPNDWSGVRPLFWAKASS
jgi:hypothetical protein